MPLSAFSQKYAKSDQLNSANFWLDYHFESNYSDLVLDPYSHKISITTTKEGFKQYIDKIYLDITDNGSSWKGAINLKKAVWKSYEDYADDHFSMKFNSEGFMIQYADFNYDGTAIAYKYHGNTYTDKQTVVRNARFEGNTTLEKPYYNLNKIKHDDTYKIHYTEYNYEDNTYRIADADGNPVVTLDLMDRKPTGSFDYTLFGVREVGTYKKGMLDGKYTKYNEEGIIKEEGIFKENYKVGTWTEFSDDFELYDLVDDLCSDHDLNFLEVLDEEKHFNIVTYNKDESIIGVVNMTYKTGEKLGYYSYSEDDDHVYGSFELFYKNGNTFIKGKYTRNGDLKNISLFKATGVEMEIDEANYINN